MIGYPLRFMFENYSIESRRVIFFGRKEAGRVGSTSIDASHILLALLAECPTLFSQLGAVDELGRIRIAIEQTLLRGEPIADTVDLPLNEAAVRVLNGTEIVAHDHGHQQIRPVHILAALVTEDRNMAVILANHGVSKETVMALVNK